MNYNVVSFVFKIYLEELQSILFSVRVGLEVANPTMRYEVRCSLERLQA
jgi:hypothetical protein